MGFGLGRRAEIGGFGVESDVAHLRGGWGQEGGRVLEALEGCLGSGIGISRPHPSPKDVTGTTLCLVSSLPQHTFKQS